MDVQKALLALGGIVAVRSFRSRVAVVWCSVRCCRDVNEGEAQEEVFYTVKSVVNLERPIIMEYLGWKESGLQGG